MAKRAARVRLAFDADDIDALLMAGGKASRRGRNLLLVLEGAESEGSMFVARRLAEARGQELERIDLGQLVSQGIGETEKTLKALFARAEPGKSILFFDEADALFARRSAVKDSQDRYANLETSFLKAASRFKGVALVAVAAAAERYPRLSKAADRLVDFGGESLGRDPDERPWRGAWDEPLTNRHFLVFIGDLEVGFCSVQGMTEYSALDEESEREATQLIPGRTQFDSLVLRRGFSRSKDLYHWRRAIRAGKDDRRTLELWQLPAPRRKPVNRWRFLGCWPCRWSGPDFDAMEGQLAFEEIEVCYDDFEWL